MNYFIATAYNGAILGPIAKVLGWIMDKIYMFMYNVFGVDNIAVTIILFTIFIYICLFPLTYSQQKFSVLSKKMNPEIKAIQAKYKGKTDTVSQQAMQEETSSVYDKYGISPMGSCVQMLIQMPILFALYRVFYNVPAYITSVKDIFTDMVNGIVATDGFAATMQTIAENANIRNLSVNFESESVEELSNYIIDLTYKLPASGWNSLVEAFPNLSSVIENTHAAIEKINYLFVLNISETPWNIMKTAFTNKQWGMIIAALMLPLLSYLSQVISIKLMPTNDAGAGDQAAMQMKSMNTFMPLMSLYIGFICPVGLVLYWVVGGVIRVIQQFFLNKHFEKIDLDQIIEKNKDKAKKKAEKRGERMNQISQAATMNTRKTLSEKANVNMDNKEAVDKANELRKSAKAGSMASKANMVKEFNEKNNK